MQCPTCKTVFAGTSTICPQCGADATFAQAAQPQAGWPPPGQPQPPAPQPPAPQPTYVQPVAIQPAQPYQAYDQQPQAQLNYVQVAYQPKPRVEKPALPPGATTSMVLGIVSLGTLIIFGCWALFPFITSPILSIIGVVQAHKANKVQKTSQGTAGAVLNWITLGLSIAGLIVSIILLVVFGASFLAYMGSGSYGGSGRYY